MIVCPSCGTENPESAKFCQECGTRLKPAEPDLPPPAPADPTASPAAEPTAAASESPASASEPPTEPERPKKDASGLPPAWMPPPVTLQSRPSAQVYQPSTPSTPAAAPNVPSTPGPAAASTPETPGTPISDAPKPPAPATSPTEKDVSGLPPVWMPPPVSPSFQGEASGGDEDWKMSDLGPVPERKNRRLWLWIPVGLMSFVLICCIAIFIWSTTIGEDTVNRWATEGAVERTEEALSGDND